MKAKGQEKNAKEFHDVELPRYIRFFPPVAIALMLIFTLRMYRDAYFSIDDFNNLYWVQQWTLGQALGQLISPSTEYFRPVGMLFYWLGLRLFDLNPQPYHWLLWSIHAVNVVLVYVVLKRIVESRTGAVTGTLIFVAPAVFSQIFWNFGTIFEVAGMTLFLIGVLIWQTRERTPGIAVIAAAVFIFALKTKEMAISLPAVWLLQDLLTRRPFRWKTLTHFAVPAFVGAWFAFEKIVQMGGTTSDHPYYIDLNGLTMGRGFGYYFNLLFTTDIRWQHWSIGFAGLLLIFLLLKKWRAAFFQSFIFVTFLPVIFLVNHREPFYWYFPILGICGLAALLTRTVAHWIARLVEPARIAPYAAALFALLCWVSYIYSTEATAERRIWQRRFERDHHNFVADLQVLPAPAHGETLFFKSVPDGLEGTVLRMATQVALRRTDVDAQLVQEFPEAASIRLEFKDGHVVASPRASVEDATPNHEKTIQ